MEGSDPRLSARTANGRDEGTAEALADFRAESLDCVAALMVE